MIRKRWLRAALKPPLHVVRAVAIGLLRPWVARSEQPHATGRARVTFLLAHAHGMGGTVRTVFTLASHLADSHDVEIVSLIRTRRKPFFPRPPGVRIRFLDDRTRPPASGWQSLLTRLPSVLMHEEDGAYDRCSLWTDVHLLRTLRSQPPGILVTTRPGMSLLAAQLAPPQVATVAQQHVSHRTQRPGIARAIARHYRALDVVAVLTEEDRRFFAELLDGASTRVVRIPNALPPATVTKHRPRAKVVVSAGRLVAQKRFDLLIDAFAAIADRYPDWSLYLYGSGAERTSLERLARRHDLTNRVVLKGRSNQLDAELAAASVFAFTSRDEGFGLVLIEAMRAGLPVVSFASGAPAELVTPEHDGLLVPDGDVGALADALSVLLADGKLRDRMAAAAHETAKHFDIEDIGSQWAQLLREIAPELRR